ncbi:response regulator transcription factor [Desnuesiella massiliensis]|uniref:response regulator transcription factor n=1 Tax=Desnuesiella massiliensis TaxID=1650662 RepID=UPI0006E3D78D|nr:response regulator transcription factor [Desnuesiella massiliensis]
MEKDHILIVDDDKDIVNLLKDILEDEGYKTDHCYNGKDALYKINNNKYDLIILDVMLPDIDGFELCRKVRDKVTIPIIFLTAKSKNLDKVIGLEIGGDDYITKPFDDSEIVARVKAHLRREKRNKISVEIQNNNVIEYGDLVLNKNSYEVSLGETKIELSTREFQILLFLAENSNRVLSREQIYNGVWGHEDYGDINTVTVHIKKLREKLDKEDKYIKTVWGVGYKFIGERKNE